MNIIQSLENIAFIRLAISVYHSPNFAEIKEKSTNSLGRFDVNRCKTLLRKQLSNYVLSKPLHEKFLDIFEPVSLEVEYWDKEMVKLGIHKRLDFCLMSSGSIDIVETIKKFVRSEDRNIAQRFALACHFWLTDDVIKIWNKSSVYERIGIEMHLLHGQSMQPTNNEGVKRTSTVLECLKKWFDWLHDGAHPHALHKFVNETFLWFSHAPPEINMLRALSPEKLRGLLTLKYAETEHYGRIYFSCLDYNQRMSFLQQEPNVIFNDYLNWPLQPKFLELVCQNWSCLTGRKFYYLLGHISSYKICDQIGSKYDYESILQELWKQCPDNLKESTKLFHRSYEGKAFISHLPPLTTSPLLRLMRSESDQSPNTTKRRRLYTSNQWFEMAFHNSFPE